MAFTDIFIRRPVLAIVVSLALLAIGLRAAGSLPVLQFPQTENAVVTVTTTYFGADPDAVAGFITTPLENAIAQAGGIDYMTSSSQSGVSTITINLQLNYDADKALTEITSKIDSVINQLPPQTQRPVLTVATNQTIDALYIGFTSDVLAENQITDYIIRTVQPKLQAVQGVQTAELLGAKTIALRAWLDPKKLAAFGLTAADVATALTSNDYISGLGNTKGQMVQVNLTASTSLHSLDEFKNLVVKDSQGAVIRLSDVATVTLGSADYETTVSLNQRKAIYVGIQVTPTANLLDVINGVRELFPQIQAQLPEGLDGQIVYDSGVFVQSSIAEVTTTLLEGLAIVTLVVFLFLGAPRAVVIPVVAIPLSLVGTFGIMLLAGFSINLLTLLALVLAIGLVVDDAIIVVENVNRHMQDGVAPIPAAIQAARDLGGPIIAMTVVLVAVYVPIGLQGGLTGALFTEFAFTLVGAVLVSAVVALTLSPMMCSRLLRASSADNPDWQERLARFVDRRLDGIRRFYGRRLSGSLDVLPVTVVFGLIVLSSIWFLYSTAQRELSPQEDQGIVITESTSAPNATLQQRELYAQQAYKVFAGVPEVEQVFLFDVPGQSIAGLVLKPWEQRTRNADTVQAVVQQGLNQVAGVRSAAFQPPPLPGSSGLPVQFVIATTEPFERLDQVVQPLLQEAHKSGLFVYLDTDLKIDLPQSTVVIDRDKTAQLGLTMSDIGNAMTAMLSGGYVNYFTLDGRSYQVIPQVQQRNRLNTNQILDYYIRSADGSLVPLSTVARITTQTIPESLNHFQQLNAATLQGVLAPGVALGDALSHLQDLAARALPQGYSIDYGGATRQFVQESSGFVVTFAFALVIIFLALSALFESFRDPVIILVSVPMSIAGALIFVNLGIGGASLNIYSEIGLVTLMGLISKHGILIVQVANDLQRQGRSKREAIEAAAGIRLRPILMTTAAMVLGVLPLILATGAGAVSRFNMGITIATGIAIGTVFTLFVVPAAYMLIGVRHDRRAKADDQVPATATGGE